MCKGVSSKLRELFEFDLFQSFENTYTEETKEELEEMDFPEMV